MMKKLAVIFSVLAISAYAWADNDHSSAPDRYYLDIDEVADSRMLLPAPPDTTSARFAYDREQYEWGKSMRNTPRGRQAVIDADLSDGWLDRTFSEAFGMKLTKENTPAIYKLMTKMKEDAGDLATRAAKQHYMRTRPFVLFNEPSATPDDEAALSKNGSYPSGHTAIGWAVAIVLSEIAPERVNEILKRGFETGQSRVIVGAHYQSDVDMGRVVGSGIVGILHANPEFMRDLANAKAEYAVKSGKKSAAKADYRHPQRVRARVN